MPFMLLSTILVLLALYTVILPHLLCKALEDRTLAIGCTQIFWGLLGTLKNNRFWRDSNKFNIYSSKFNTAFEVLQDIQMEMSVNNVTWCGA